MMGYGNSGWGIIPMVVFWILTISAAVWLLSLLFPRQLGDSGSGDETAEPSPTEAALDILERRYARGELSSAEYEKMRGDLSE
jgi:putative membrane protein